MLESEVKAEIIRVLMDCQKYLRFWNNPTGVSKAGDRTIRYGVVGSADIIGIVKDSGRFLAIELKSSKGKLREAQKNWGQMIVDFGGVYIVARSGIDLIGELKGLGVIPESLALTLVEKYRK